MLIRSRLSSMRSLLALVILHCTSHSLQAGPTSGMLPKDRMVDILADLELTRAVVYGCANANQAVANQLFREHVQCIYQKYAVDPAVFQQSYLYYLNHPELMQDIYVLVIARLEELLL